LIYNKESCKEKIKIIGKHNCVDVTHTVAAMVLLPFFNMVLAFFLEFLRYNLIRETGENLSVKPASEAKYTASISLPLFTSSSIISGKMKNSFNEDATKWITESWTSMQVNYESKQFHFALILSQII